MSRKSTHEFFFTVEQLREREKLGCWEKFKLCIYDSKTREVLGKTGYAWGM